jgi:hypothetical protein
VPASSPATKTREPRKPRSPRTRAALIATAVAVPLVVVLALVFSIGDVKDGSSPSASRSHSPSATAPLAAITVAAPPSSAATVAPCTKVLEKLPVALGDLPSRVVHPQPDSPFVVAWGDPAIVLRCGVQRPADLKANSTAQTEIVDGVVFLVNDRKQNEPWVFTAVDRAPYIEVTVPASYSQPPLAPLADTISKALPAICTVPPAPVPNASPVPTDELCTRRK